LKDKRVQVETRDVAVILRSRIGQFDAVLLDVDNGPAAMTDSNNAGLYDSDGIAAAHASLKKEGVQAIWAAKEDRKFVRRLRGGGFEAEVQRARGRLTKGGPRHTVFVGRKITGGSI
jgi:spermidine synthase